MHNKRGRSSHRVSRDICNASFNKWFIPDYVTGLTNQNQKDKEENKMMSMSHENTLYERYPNGNNHMKRYFIILVISEIEAQP